MSAVGLGLDVGEAEVEDHLVMVWLMIPDLDEVGAEGDECAVGLGLDVGEAEVEDHLVMAWLMISGVAK